MNPFAAFVPTLLVKLGKARPRVTLLQVPAAFTAPRTDHATTISSDFNFAILFFIMYNMVMKKCSVCKSVKRLSNFYKRTFNNIKKMRPECKNCSYNYYKNYVKNNRHKIREYDTKYRLKHFFGLSIEKYNEIGISHNWQCGICHIKQSDCNKKLAVDHNHKTGIIRGLLCSKCNHGLGFFKDNISLLEKAIIYLKPL